MLDCRKKYSLSQLGEVQGNGASAALGIGRIGHYQLLITNYLLPILDRTSSF